MKMLVAFFAVFAVMPFALANGDNYYSFKKSDSGSLALEEQVKFDELNANAQEQESVYIYLNLMRSGEATEKDPEKRAEQEIYFAETKAELLSDLDTYVLDYSERRPGKPDMYMNLQPSALLLILDDPRIQSFTIFKDRWQQSTNVTLVETVESSDVGDE